MDGWHRLERELEHWQRLSRRPTLWWRDDDAQHDSPALRRLCELSRAFSIPLALAVIPQGADKTLVPLFEQTDGLYALQHGYSHQNHAAADQRKCELGDDRPMALILDELQRGMQQLQALLGDRFAPVLVPPWNRLSDSLIANLSAQGFSGLSTLGPRQAKQHCGLKLNHVHVDLINWRSRNFAGEEVVLEQLISHLQLRRSCQGDTDEATGLMTHHLAHDEACWEFCQRLFSRLSSGSVRWLEARGELF